MTMTGAAVGGRYYRPPRGRIFVSGMSRGSTDASSMDMSQGAMHTPSFRIAICSLAGLHAKLSSALAGRSPLGVRVPEGVLNINK